MLFAGVAEGASPGLVSRRGQGETDMADRGKRDKGKREQQKKSKLTPKERRKLKRAKKAK